MLRNVVMMKFKSGYDQELLGTLIQRLKSLNCPGTIGYSIGLDAGLREGNWDLAIVADFEDIDSYRGYDSDDEHNRIRAELAGLLAEVARAQFIL